MSLNIETIAYAACQAVQRYVDMTGGQDIVDDGCERVIQVFVAEWLAEQNKSAAATCEWTVGDIAEWANIPIRPPRELISQRIDIIHFADGNQISDLIEIKRHEWIKPGFDKLQELFAILSIANISGYAIGCRTISKDDKAKYRKLIQYATEYDLEVREFDLSHKNEHGNAIVKRALLIFVAEVPRKSVPL